MSKSFLKVCILKLMTLCEQPQSTLTCVCVWGGVLNNGSSFESMHLKKTVPTNSWLFQFITCDDKAQYFVLRPCSKLICTILTELWKLWGLDFDRRREVCTHYSCVWANFHWLPISFTIDFKILLITFKALNGLVPNSIEHLLTPYEPERLLRSVDAALLVVPSSS